MRFFAALSATVLLLATTASALPHPHPNSLSLKPRQEQGVPTEAANSNLRNMDLVMKQSDLDENGNLKPSAQKKVDPDNFLPFFSIDDVDCGARIKFKGRDPSAALEQQLLILCEQMEDKV